MFWLIWLVILLATPWLFLWLLWRVRFSRRSEAVVPILAYHRVSDIFDWSITRQKRSQFERGMKYLYDQGYRAVRLTEVLDSGEDGDDKRVALTFDDAYQDLYLNAFPVLKEFGFAACVFVITGYVGGCSGWDYDSGGGKRRHLSWEQMHEMADAGFDFGSHTVNHPDLTRIPKRFVEHELKTSKEILEDRLGRSVDFLSYPFGRYNRYVQEEAQRLGYKGACTLCSHPEENGLPPFSRRRWGVYLLDSPLTLRTKLNQGRLLWIEEMKARVINGFSTWTTIFKGSPDYEEGRDSLHPQQSVG